MTVSVERIGLGTLIDEYITVSASTTVAQIVEDRLAAYGYTTYHEGSPTDSGYFLNDIQKPGIPTGGLLTILSGNCWRCKGFRFWDPASLISLEIKPFLRFPDGWWL